MNNQILDWQRLLSDLNSLGNQMINYEHSVINLIASDNAFPRVVSENPVYSGHILQEGLLGERPFAGAKLHDEVEKIASEIACAVFGSEHANLQPHSCSQANQAVYHAILSPKDTALSLDFSAGGHLTHGLKYNFSGRHFNFIRYGLNNDELIDYDGAQKLALANMPKLIVCGSSSYPRLFDAMRLREIADSVGAKLMFDLSHESGLIAGGAIPNIVNIADVTTMSIDKTLRGPFGGIILCKQNLGREIDRAVHPGTQSSFPVRKIASAAQSLLLTQSEGFKEYASNVLNNAKVFEESFHPNVLFTKGTDKHYVVLNVRDTFGMSGTQAEKRLEEIGILSNRQTIPSDTSKRMDESSGLRLGSAWATSRGYSQSDFKEICILINEALSGSFERSHFFELSNRVNIIVAKKRPNDVWIN